LPHLDVYLFLPCSKTALQPGCKKNPAKRAVHYKVKGDNFYSSPGTFRGARTPVVASDHLAGSFMSPESELNEHKVQTSLVTLTRFNFVRHTSHARGCFALGKTPSWISCG